MHKTGDKSFGSRIREQSFNLLMKDPGVTEFIVGRKRE